MSEKSLTEETPVESPETRATINSKVVEKVETCMHACMCAYHVVITV